MIPGGLDTAFDLKRSTLLLQAMMRQVVGLGSRVHIAMNDTQDVEKLSANLRFKGTWSGQPCTLIGRNVDAHLSLADYSGFLQCQTILIG